MGIPTVGNHVVRRPFQTDGKQMVPGEIVDVTGWRNAFQLVDRGFLMPQQSKKTMRRFEASLVGNAPINADADVVTENRTVSGEEGNFHPSPCPKCGAALGQTCVSKNGNPAPDHAGRYKVRK